MLFPPVGSPMARMCCWARESPHVGASLEIWVMGKDGDNPKRVVEAAEPKVSVMSDNRTTSQLLTRVFLSGVAWSPDGKRLAYFRRFEADSPGPVEDKRSRETVEVSGGTQKVPKVSRQLLPVACWATDDRLLYGYRDNPASERLDYGIWSVRISQKSGEPEDKEMQVTASAGRPGGLSVSADGKRLVLWRENLSPQVFLTQLEAKNHQFTTPRRLTLDEHPNIVTDGMPDSRAVLFISNRNGTYKLFRQAIDQAVPEVLVEGRSIFQPRVSPNGTEVLYLAGYNPEDPAKPVSVMAVPVSGGPSRVVLQMSFIGDLMCARSPSKLCLLVNNEQAVSFDPENGTVQPFASLQWSSVDAWSLAPDGSQLTLAYNSSKHTITFVNVGQSSRRDVELEESIHRS